MPTTPISPDMHRRILEMVAQGCSHRHIRSVTGLSLSTISEYRHKTLNEETPEPSIPAPSSSVASETNEIAGDKWTITLPKTRISTLEQLLEHCKVDLSVWEVERFICNKWEMGFVRHSEKNGAKGNTVSETIDRDAATVPLFQVKAFLRRKRNVVDARKELEDLKALAKEISYSKFTYTPKTPSSGNMLEINIPDAHFGKLAWGVETGGPNYDTKIAERIFMEAIETLLDRVSAYEFDEVWFVIGNDLLNSDNKEGTTTGGTPVSNDSRYQKTYRIVRTCIVRATERLRKIARVKVRVIAVPGNHDNESVFHLGDSVECYFHDKADVEVDNSPRKFKYHQFGKVMLMFTHGDKGKRADYPLLMATQQPVMFGSTKFREAHTGHTHTTKLDEQHGVRVRVLPALCPADDWHAENGLTGNLRNAEAYVWNKDEGLVTVATYSADAREAD